MKVIIVAPSLNSKITLGGISAVASFIVDNNHDVDYIHFEQGKRDAEKGGFHRIDNLISIFKKWRSIINKTPEAVIHYNLPLSPAAIIRDYAFMKFAHKHGNKMVVHVHGGLYMNTENIPCLIKWLLKDIFSWNIPFIVLSDRERDVLKNRYGTSIVHVLPNCVEIDETYCKSYNNEILTLGYIGRITTNKGMRELLEVCKILKERHISFKLAIAGAEDATTHFIQSFKELLVDSFKYVGIVSGEEKIEFLKSLDIFILPSYFEGLPMSLLECMSYGVVPISTRVGSIPELIKDNANGFLIELKNAESIVDKVLSLNIDRLKMKQIGICARKTIIDNFNPQVYIDSLNQIYGTL